jgi:hypothetical protein
MYRNLAVCLAFIFSFYANAITQPIVVEQDVAKALKKPGIIRIGVSAPATDMGIDFDFADAPTAVMNTLQVALTDE